MSIIHFFILDAYHSQIGIDKYIQDKIQEQDSTIESVSKHKQG